MHIDLTQKSDVGHLRLESPTSDIDDDNIEKRSVRVVPLRDLARYAGRLVRASVAEDSEMLITDRGRPLVLITPVGPDRPTPRYAWANDELVERTQQEPPRELPPHLEDDLRIVGELLLQEPLSTDGVTQALDWSVGRASIALVKLEIEGLAYRKGASWHLSP